MSVKLLAFAGSARTDSCNKKLLRIMVAGAEEAGAEVTVADLRDFPMPLMDEDLEAAEGMPEHAQRFKDLMIAHDGFLIACPEYNSSITPLLKNTIDWASRRPADEKPLLAFDSKTAAICSASPGAIGGLRGLPEVRRILSNLKVLVVPGDTSVGSASGAFNDDGSMKDDKQEARIKALAARLVEFTAALQQ